MTASKRPAPGPDGDHIPDPMRLGVDLYRAGLAYWTGVFKYTNEFMLPYWTALSAFLSTEKDKLVRYQPADSFKDYAELFQFNLQVAEKGGVSSLAAMNEHHTAAARQAFAALLNTLEQGDGEGIDQIVSRQAELLEYMVYRYPTAIRAIKAQYGFHFDDGGYRKATETDRFVLYQVLPRNGVAVRPNGKPILIVPPYVLGANILAFLPAENKSYVHAYADQGIPTYVRIIKDIDTTPAVQTLTGEEDALDLKFFSEHLLQEHGRPSTLNGFCQGGFVALTGLLSGELDGLVDALITCVAPMDGTRSKALIDYLRHLPSRFRDLGYAVKNLPNGNRVVDGKVMSWVYKLKSMEKEAPLYSFYSDLMRMDRHQPLAHLRPQRFARSHHPDEFRFLHGAGARRRNAAVQAVRPIVELQPAQKDAASVSDLLRGGRRPGGQSRRAGAAGFRVRRGDRFSQRPRCHRHLLVQSRYRIRPAQAFPGQQPRPGPFPTGP
jgi:hypothetical protein